MKLKVDPLATCRVEPHPSAEVLDDGPSDGQAEACSPSSGSVESNELGEDLLTIGLLDARTVVGDVDPDLPQHLMAARPEGWRRRR